MKLLWLDLETSGLDPRADRILEIAAYTADLERPFDEPGIGDGPMPEHTNGAVHVVMPYSRERIDGFSDFIKEMHEKNGLLQECQDLYDQGGTRLDLRMFTTESDLIEILPPRSDDKEDRPVLAGSSVHFDLGFLRVHMPRLAARLSHRVYDVSAVKLFCRSLGMPALPTGDEAHRALPDVRYSVRVARACAEWLRDYYPGLRGAMPGKAL